MWKSSINQYSLGHDHTEVEVEWLMICGLETGARNQRQRATTSPGETLNTHIISKESIYALREQLQVVASAVRLIERALDQSTLILLGDFSKGALAALDRAGSLTAGMLEYSVQDIGPAHSTALLPKFCKTQSAIT